ncbi:MAG TPA: helix-turn-helix transcriptional regulator [Polyangium sp.]|nr:helix-turn-helix transcriptional regulator [Polyangium sp.]
MPRRSIPEPIAAKVGARIRELRIERGMSLAALANAAGLSKGHMSSVERGLVLITVGTVVSTAKALGVPPFVLTMFPDEEPLSAVIEHVRSTRGGDTTKAASKLRKLVFGQVASPGAPSKKRPKR